MKIYTKTGDKGKSGLIGGTRVSKADTRLEAYGTVDELNAHIGLLGSYKLQKREQLFLENIQNTLFVIGSNLATDQNKTNLKNASRITTTSIEEIEKEIDHLSDQLAPIRSFTLPAGSKKSAQCHICRTVARRAERRIAQLNELHPVDTNVAIYINRLSDYFFVLSRKLLKDDNICEIAWKQPK